jgi:hypothetical protein
MWFLGEDIWKKRSRLTMADTWHLIVRIIPFLTPWLRLCRKKERRNPKSAGF